jgi:hypothetical protein
MSDAPSKETALKEALETGRFVKVRPASPTALQIRCVICNGMGYAWGKWYDDHLKDHDYPCDTCGVSYLSVQALNTHRQKSKAHAA